MTTDQIPTAPTAPRREPTDHLAPADRTAPAAASLRTVTYAGREWTVDADALADDYDFVDALAAADGGDGLASVRALRIMLGTEQHAALKALVRDPATGRTSARAMIEALYAILGEASTSAEVDAPHR